MMLDKRNTYLLLGSNLGDKKSTLAQAIIEITNRVGEVFAVSKWYETAAWGKTDQPNFYNLALGVNTTLTPTLLLQEILNIETDLGRKRIVKWGPRTIDIDIIFYGNDVVNDGDILQIPHPAMQNRKFVLMPLLDIAPNIVHPILKKSVKQLHAELLDETEVWEVNF